MRTATVTAVLDAPEREVFDYLADVQNLPEWATEFARELRREGEGYKIGQRPRRVLLRDPRRPARRRDRHVRRADEGARWRCSRRARSRLPDGRTAYSFTMFQAPDMPDELFEAQHESLQREFANIARRFNH